MDSQKLFDLNIMAKEIEKIKRIIGFTEEWKPYTGLAMYKADEETHLYFNLDFFHEPSFRHRLVKLIKRDLQDRLEGLQNEFELA